MKTALLLAAVCLFIASSKSSAQPADQPAEFSTAELEFFEREVRPLLAANCYECHSVKATKLQGSLLLDSRATAMRGGDSGPAVVPKNLDESLLIEAVRHEGFAMPPTGKLPELAT
jgi:hypothetical protein